MNEEEKKPSQETNSDRGITRDVVTSVAKGAVEGVGESLKTIELLGSLANDYLGVKASIDPSVQPSSSEINMGQSVLDFADSTFGEAQSVVGKFAETASKFATGMAIGGAAFKGVKLAMSAARLGGVATRAGGVLANSSKLNKYGKMALEGAPLGAASDFLVTGEEDTLLTEMFIDLPLPVKDAIGDYSDNGDEALLLKKLTAIPEGILLGAGANIGLNAGGKFIKAQVLPKIQALAKRVKEKDFLGTEALLKERDVKFQELVDKDPLKGKTYQNENLVRVVDDEGVTRIVKESDAKKPRLKSENPRQNKTEFGEDLKGLFSEEEQFILNGIEENIKRDKNLGKKVGAIVENADATTKVIAKGKIPENLDSLNVVDKINAVMNATKEGYKEFMDNVTLTPKTIKSLPLDDREALKEVGELFPGLAEKIRTGDAKFSATDVVLETRKLEFLIDEYDVVTRQLADNIDDPYIVEEALRIADTMALQNNKIQQMGSTFGQGLSVFGIEMKNLRIKQNAQQLKRYLDGREEDIAKVKDLAIAKYKKMKDIPLDQKQEVYALMSNKEKISTALHEIYTANLLFGVKTQIINVGSNMAQGGFKALGRALVGIASSDTVSREAAKAYLSRLTSYNSFLNAFSSAGQAFKTKVLPPHLVTDQSSATSKYDIMSKGFSVLEERARELKINPTPMYYATHYLGLVTSLPGRTLVAGDAFFKHIGFEALGGDIYTQAFLKNGKDLSEEQIASGLSLIKQGKYDDPMFKNIELAPHLENFNRELEEFTFTMEPNGFQKKLNNFLGTELIPGLKPGRLLVPFVNVPFNLTRIAIQNSPVVNRFSPTVQKIMREGTAQEIERKQAEIMVSGTLMTLGAGWYAMGGITGHGPSNKQERIQLEKAGWKASSIKTSSGYLELEKLGPAGQFMAYSTYMADLLDTLDSNDLNYEDKASELTAISFSFASEMFIPQFLSEAVPKIGDIINGDESALKEFSKISSEIVANSIPLSGIYARNKAYLGNPQIGDFSFNHTELGKAIRRQLPWLDTDIMPQVDVFGEARMTANLFSNLDIEMLGELERLSSQGYTDTDELGVTVTRLFSPPNRELRIQTQGARVKTYTLGNKDWFDYQRAAAGVYDKESQGFNPMGMSFKDYWKDQKSKGYPGAQIYSSGGKVSDEAIVTHLKMVHKIYKQAAKSFIESRVTTMEGVSQGSIEAVEKRQKALQGVKFKN
jgi:hypothetical protein